MGERERERDFVLYFTASFCLYILYYLANGTKNEFKIILLRRFDGQQITRQIYLTNFNLTFGHKLLSVKKNVNIFALKFEYSFIKLYTEFNILRWLIQSKLAITIQPFWIVSKTACWVCYGGGERGILILSVTVCNIWLMDLEEGIGGNVFNKFHCLWFHGWFLDVLLVRGGGNVCNRFNCITRVTSPAGDGSNPSGAKHIWYQMPPSKKYVN